MKYLLIITALLFISCNQEFKKTSKDIMRENIEDKFIESLNDPSSYEFVSLENIDTVFTKQYYSNMLVDAKTELSKMSNYDAVIAQNKKDAAEFRSYGSQYESDALKSDQMSEKLTKLRNKSQELVKSFEDKYNAANQNEILNITADLKFRANNALDAKIINTYRFYLSDSLSVMDYKKI